MTRFTIILISILILVSVLACTITTVIPVTVDTDPPVAEPYKRATLAKPPAPPAVLDAGEKQAEP